MYILARLYNDGKHELGRLRIKKGVWEASFRHFTAQIQV
jgi:hypothetical protein